MSFAIRTARDDVCKVDIDYGLHVACLVELLAGVYYVERDGLRFAGIIDLDPIKEILAIVMLAVVLIEEGVIDAGAQKRQVRASMFAPVGIHELAMVGGITP